ncbi:type II toxin-antitoxin system ParD family antitoxin [Pseudidiomarina aestuarii]|uniref:type II toxin-antitoxin system ParD family antitoxin n=1 Tax=Pseudidiomarina aestuarii TaxID=624146 RepID=UPI003A97DC05
MSKNTSISLGDHFDQFVDQLVASGRYASTSEVIRAGLRKLEEDQAKLETLRSLLQEGIASGTAEYTYDSLMAEIDNELGK